MLITSLLYLFSASAKANEQLCTQEEIQMACAANSQSKQMTGTLPGDFNTNISQYCTVNTVPSKPSIDPLQTKQIPNRIDGQNSAVSMKEAPTENNKAALQKDTAESSTVTLTNLVSILVALVGIFVAGFSLSQGKKKMSK